MYTFIAKKMQTMIRPSTRVALCFEALAVKAVSNEKVKRNDTWKQDLGKQRS